ncbi:unnamed protein product, partial [Brassica oleracea var. botrytis]
IPDGKQIVIEGQRQFNYEFFPKMTSPDVIEMPFLADTYVKEDNNNPYSYTGTDGNLFTFANNRAILFNYGNNTVFSLKRSTRMLGSRVTTSNENPQWTVEKMPRARVMGDMTLLPNGDVLLINSGSAGSAAWELGRERACPKNPVNSRFESLNPNTIPRMYHSTAILLRDGRVLVRGSNPHAFYSFTRVLFPS